VGELREAEAPAAIFEEPQLPHGRQILNEKFKTLWMGDISAYNDDHSAADLALMGLLARTPMFERNPEILRSVFSLSKLADRDKWRRRKNYQDSTIKKALESDTPLSGWCRPAYTGQLAKSLPTALTLSTHQNCCRPV
jgi:hypothetical protein